MEFKNAGPSQITVKVEIPESMLPSEAYARAGTVTDIYALVPRMVEAFTQGLLLLIRLVSAASSSARGHAAVRRIEEAVEQVIVDNRLTDLDDPPVPEEPATKTDVESTPANTSLAVIEPPAKSDPFGDFFNSGSITKALDEFNDEDKA